MRLRTNVAQMSLISSWARRSIQIKAGPRAWQAWSTRGRQSAACLVAFLHNHWVGGVLFAGVFLGYLLVPATTP